MSRLPTHSELVQDLVKAPAAINRTLTFDAIDLWHGATGVAGEGGELLEALVGWGNDYDPMGTAPHEAEGFETLDKDNVIEELGDIEFYMEQLRQRTGITLDLAHAMDAGSFVPISLDRLLHNGAHLAAACANVLDVVKKHAIYNKELDLPTLSEAMARVDIWMAVIRYQLGIDRNDVLNANIKKLLVRYEGGRYSDEAAQKRADKA